MAHQRRYPRIVTKGDPAALTVYLWKKRVDRYFTALHRRAAEHMHRMIGDSAAYKLAMADCEHLRP